MPQCGLLFIRLEEILASLMDWFIFMLVSLNWWGIAGFTISFLTTRRTKRGTQPLKDVQDGGMTLLLWTQPPPPLSAHMMTHLLSASSKTVNIRLDSPVINTPPVLEKLIHYIFHFVSFLLTGLNGRRFGSPSLDFGRRTCNQRPRRSGSIDFWCLQLADCRYLCSYIA